MRLGKQLVGSALVAIRDGGLWHRPVVTIHGGRHWRHLVVAVRGGRRSRRLVVIIHLWTSFVAVHCTPLSVTRSCLSNCLASLALRLELGDVEGAGR